MKRRSKGEGSVYLLSDGRWAFAIVRNGRRSIVTGKTRPEALRKGERLKSTAGSSRQFLSDYLKIWIERKDDIRELARTTYRWAIEQYLAPDLGRVRLCHLDASTIEDAYAEWKRKGKSAAVIQKVHTTLSSALTDAERLGYIPLNPCRRVRYAHAQRRPVNVWEPEQVLAFLQAIRAHPYYAFFLLMLTTGMRPGEIFGLTWQNVDLANGLVRVVQTLENVNGKRNIVEPKTRAGWREISLPARTVAALSNLPRTAKFVFANTKGGALQDDTFRSRVWKPLLEELDLPYIRMYDLRHTANTLILGHLKINQKVAQERMGHSSVRVTQDIYGHVLPSMQREVLSVLDGFFGVD